MSDAAYLVRLHVTARSSWSPAYDNFVLVLADETEIRARALLRRPDAEGPARATVPQGESVLELLFANGGPSLAPPDSLQLEEPAVTFALPEAVSP
jgi:hypothetical protein